LILYKYKGSPNQKFSFVPDTEGFYSIVSL
jgi:hypothetical protein